VTVTVTVTDDQNVMSCFSRVCVLFIITTPCSSPWKWLVVRPSLRARRNLAAALFKT